MGLPDRVDEAGLTLTARPGLVAADHTNMTFIVNLILTIMSSAFDCLAAAHFCIAHPVIPRAIADRPDCLPYWNAGSGHPDVENPPKYPESQMLA
jgi:hypothetical protein